MTAAELPINWEGQLELDFTSGSADAPTLDQARASVQFLIDRALEQRSSKDFVTMLRRVAKFKRYSPVNAMLAQLQLPGASYVLPPQAWESRYGRRLKPGVQPIVMLQPFAPVMFVYDVSQTEGPALPQMIEAPYRMADVGAAKKALQGIVRGVPVDFVRLTFVPQGSQAAGCISTTDGWGTQPVQVKTRPQPVIETVPVFYEAIINSSLSPTEQLTTVAHELGHLYCGHVGTRDDKRWRDRRTVSTETSEIEAEAVAHLVCQRLDQDVELPPHLYQYVERDLELPPVDVQRVMAAAGRILEMTDGRLPRVPRDRSAR